MIILGIETSCDETSCAVLEGRNRILSNIISSSLFRHRAFGGIVPEIASRHSLEQIDFVFRHALKTAGRAPGDLDLIAVTRGPGLIGSLLVGIMFAKSLSYQLEIPLVGVNHLEAHLAANFIGRKTPARYIGLIASGGHTALWYQERGRFSELGATVDDAAGEAFDKVAKMMGLGYPGGPILERLAAKGDPRAFSFTRPKQKNRFDFSFSGIKTAVFYALQKRKKITDAFRRDMAASFQNAVITWLVEKTMDAAKTRGVKNIVVGGGVSANTFLRKRLQERAQEEKIKVSLPPLSLTLDNAAMIARRGIELYGRGRRDSLRLTGEAGLSI